jgi:hypothetical protein
LTPIPKQSVPGLPFTDQKELDKLAKVFTEKELPKRDAISINTDDLRYLTYMLGLKRRIEFILQYPPRGRRRYSGELLLSHHSSGRPARVLLRSIIRPSDIG